jgi:hypothetical protein
VTPTAMATGQAAGVCAALAAATGKTPRDLPVEAVQAELIRQGADLRQSDDTQSGVTASPDDA